MAKSKWELLIRHPTVSQVFERVELFTYFDEVDVTIPRNSSLATAQDSIQVFKDGRICSEIVLITKHAVTASSKYMDQ